MSAASSFIQEELQDVKARISKLVTNASIIGCHQANVQIRIVRTKHKQCLCQFQFPANYPDEPILIEVKSKVLSGKVLDAITQVAEKEAKKLLGKQQIISLIKFINNILEENPLFVCSDEVSKVKKKLVQEQDEFKVKQKTGVIDYRMAVKITVQYRLYIY